MTLPEILPWASAALDATIIALMFGLMRRFAASSQVDWEEREAKLREIFDGLRVLVAQAEGQARDLDSNLGQHAERLAALVREAEGLVEPRGRRASAAAAPAPAAERPLADRVRQLAASETPVEEIARRLSLPIADVRVLLGLRGQRAGAEGALA
jgi:hypothetical protein